jgi:DNA polymerase-3 subunit alpha
MGVKNDLIKSAAFERRDGECSHTHQTITMRAQRRQRAVARQHRNLKPMRFVSLHHHSTLGSYLDGYQLPEAHVRRATEINMSSMAMTEHGNIDSHVKFEIAAEAQGVKPIFGCEFYTGFTDDERRSQRKYHLTVLAATQEGYRNLLQLVTKSFAEGYYYHPTISGQMLYEHRKGLIVLSGCQGSLLFCSAVGGKMIEEKDASYKRAREVARWFGAKFGDAYYIEVQGFPELDKTTQFAPMAENLSRELGIGLVGSMDCHYTAPEEVELQKVLHNVRPGEKRTLEEQVQSWGYTVPLCPPPNDMSIYRRLRATGLSRQAAIEAVVNTEEIASRCTVTLPKLPMVKYPLPRGYTDEQDLWRDWIKEGWRYRNCHKLPADEFKQYQERLAYEMSLIEGKGFISYFLIVSDSVKYAKDAGIPVGPARGSAAASLVAWLLRITEVNPMLFPNLVFERFIDVSREDLPDIDLDFDSDRRHEVREYLVSKYGAKCVNNIGTFSYYKSKVALDDIARVYGVPTYEVERVKELLIERSSGDLRASATIEDTVEQFDAAREVFERWPQLYLAMDLEGNIKSSGVHSAGLVVSNEPIENVCAVHSREVKKRLITCVSMDKYDAERQGLLKLDYLGLSTMAMIAEALRQLDLPLTYLYELPLDDERVIDGFRENDVVGIFQFDGRAMRSVCGALRPDSFKEICDVNALSRPGPLHNGAANQYIDIKRGATKPELIHPALDSITADTHYQIVYQEQILRVVTEIGNFDWTHASYIRKIISKKLGEQEFQRQWERFWDGARTWHERGEGREPITEALAKKIWGLCITSGSYAFNAAHCVSYGMLGYWTMWIKRYHPAVFYAASLQKMPKGKGSGSAGERGGNFSGVKTDRHAGLLRDATKGRGERKAIEVLPPDPFKSGVDWIATDEGLLAGWRQAGAGAVGVKAVEYREQHGVERWQDYEAVSGVGPKTIEKMVALQEAEDPFEVHKLDNLLADIKRQLPHWGIPAPTHTAMEVPYERGRDEAITWIGLGLDRNLRDIYESNRARTGVELKPEEVKQPELNEWVMILGTDGDEVVTLRIDRFKYPKFRSAVWGLKLGRDVIVAKGIKPGFRTAREIYVKQLWIIDPED